MTTESGWVTELSTISNDLPTLHGYDLLELASKQDFATLVYFTCTREMPKPGQKSMLDMILGSVIIHGVAPTGAIARGLSRSGVPTQVAVAGALLSIGDIHGGAGEQLGEAMHVAAAEVGVEPLAGFNAEQVLRCAELINEHFRAQGQRVPGLGHMAHPEGDPRAPILLARAQELGVAQFYCEVMNELESVVARRSGRRIACNIDGAMTAIMADLGIPWQFARVILMIGRTAGLGAQVVEEMLRPTPQWRSAILPNETYVGPEPVVSPQSP